MASGRVSNSVLQSSRPGSLQLEEASSSGGALGLELSESTRKQRHGNSNGKGKRLAIRPKPHGMHAEWALAWFGTWKHSSVVVIEY